MTADVGPASMAHALELMTDADVTQVLARVAVPALRIWGEQDARSLLTVAQAFERHPRRHARRYSRLRARQQPRAARRCQRRDPRLCRGR